MESLQMGGRSDPEWVQQLRDGDKDAHDALFTLLYDVAYANVRKFLDNLDHQTYEDVASDAAIAAYERLTRRGVAQFNHRAAFKSYCYRCVANEIHRRAKKLKSSRYLELFENTIYDAAAHKTVNPDAILERLRPCLNRLQKQYPDRFTVIDMRYLQQKSTSEIAASIGKSRNYTDKLSQRARADLNRCMQDYGYSSANDVSDLESS